MRGFVSSSNVADLTVRINRRVRLLELTDEFGLIDQAGNCTAKIATPEEYRANQQTD